MSVNWILQNPIGLSGSRNYRLPPPLLPLERDEPELPEDEELPEELERPDDEEPLL